MIQIEVCHFSGEVYLNVVPVARQNSVVYGYAHPHSLCDAHLCRSDASGLSYVGRYSVHYPMIFVCVVVCSGVRRRRCNSGRFVPGTDSDPLSHYRYFLLETDFYSASGYALGSGYHLVFGGQNGCYYVNHAGGFVEPKNVHVFV